MPKGRNVDGVPTALPCGTQLYRAQVPAQNQRCKMLVSYRPLARLIFTQCRGVKLRASKPHSNRRPAIAVIGVTITVGAMLDRRSLSYAALGLGPSWMLLDGVSPPVFFFLMIVMV